ncbi:MAG: thymidine kinase [Bacteroidetes bacterium]|nr:MAG: thymidine kinase [Bacteroidota bacterium]
MRGYIRVISGCMFSGKTEELISQIRRAPYAKHKVQVFKASLDDRYHASSVVAHHEASVQAIAVTSAQQLLHMVEETTTIVAVDEAQFFDKDLPKVCEHLADRGLGVIVAGLDTDFRGEPFGPMPYLMSIAEEVVKKHAYCSVCGGPASRSQRLIGGHPASYESPVTFVGGRESYEARCREHHIVPGKPSFE